MKRPLIGVTLDSEKPGGYSKYPWYALRQNYMEAISAAGGLPITLPHEAPLAVDYLDRLMRWWSQVEHSMSIRRCMAARTGI